MRFAAGLAASLLGVAIGGVGVVQASPYPAAWLPKHGEGYVIPDTWAERGLRYGRPELIGLVGRAAERVAGELPGSMLYVGDLSLKNGGWTPWHRSHRSGCDADLLFFAVDDDGQPRDPPEEMISFDDAGVAVLPDGRTLRFDTPRNWALVKALLDDREARVGLIFVSEGLRAQLLAYARGAGEPQALVERAAIVLGQPSDSAAHDDHFHVRIVPPLDEQPRLIAKARVGKVIKAVRGKASPAKKLVRHKRGRR